VTEPGVWKLGRRKTFHERRTCEFGVESKPSLSPEKTEFGDTISHCFEGLTCSIQYSQYSIAFSVPPLAPHYFYANFYELREHIFNSWGGKYSSDFPSLCQCYKPVATVWIWTRYSVTVECWACKDLSLITGVRPASLKVSVVEESVVCRPQVCKVHTFICQSLTFCSATQPFIWCSRFSCQSLRLKYGTPYLFTSANPKHTLPSDVILRRTTFFQPILSPSGPHNAPWFSSETLALYKSLTHLRSFSALQMVGWVYWCMCLTV